MVLTSCSTNKVNEWETPYDVVYEAAVGVNTKADDGLTGDYPADLPFDVWAYSLAKPKTWAENGVEAEVSMERVRSKHVSGRKWVPENGLAWGPASKRMSFFAASPSGRADYSHENGISFSAYSLDEGILPMYVDGVTDLDKTASRGLVTMTFSNALASVSFSGKASVSGNHVVKVKKITMTEICSEGDFVSRPIPRWIPSGERDEVVFFEGSIDLEENPVDLVKETYMIPQSAEVEIRMVCDISSGEGKLTDQVMKASTTISWNPGKRTAYMLKIANDLSLIVEKDPN